jgi:hypothetical protein
VTLSGRSKSTRTARPRPNRFCNIFIYTFLTFPYPQMCQQTYKEKCKEEMIEECSMHYEQVGYWQYYTMRHHAAQVCHTEMLQECRMAYRQDCKTEQIHRCKMGYTQVQILGLGLLGNFYPSRSAAQLRTARLSRRKSVRPSTRRSVTRTLARPGRSR